MKVLITGGAGFIGINSAHRFLQQGYEVILFDNVSRKGNEENITWLKTQGEFELFKGDISKFENIKACFSKYGKIDVVLHLAAQVAVTTSISNPRQDFEVNALGTFNICEAVRQFMPDSIIINASTNKVYGRIDYKNVLAHNDRYEYEELDQGISEKQPLDFHSPYGCSKGVAEQYVRDYARIYGLKTVNFRQSCIYGPHQFGIEEQGWVAWFTICAVLGKPIKIFGDGKQVRDLLFIDDLIDGYFKAVENIQKISGQIYNVGGGPGNTLSLFELIDLLQRLIGQNISYSFFDWRPGDQQVFICDIRKAEADLNWKPSTKISEGIKNLYNWVRENQLLLKKVVEG